MSKILTSIFQSFGLSNVYFCQHEEYLALFNESCAHTTHFNSDGYQNELFPALQASELFKQKQIYLIG